MNASAQDQRDELLQRCKDIPMSVARGPEFDERLILIRSDGSAWGETIEATSVDELGDDDLALACESIEPADLGCPDFIQECAYWRFVPGLQDWLAGGPHPATLAQGKAIALRQGAVHIDRDFQRITLNGQAAIVSEHAFAQLLADPDMVERALDDPRRFAWAQRDDLSTAWAETTFARAIFFHADALPAIPAEEIILARQLPDGGWLFEHPTRPQWLCRMDKDSNAMTTRLYLHNGMPVRDFPPQED